MRKPLTEDEIKLEEPYPKVLSSKLRRDGPDRLTFFCPGCQELHSVNINKENGWLWNGYAQAPSFKPIIVIKKIKDGEIYQCLSSIEQGTIDFSNYSTHNLKGHLVSLPDYFTI